LRSMLSRRQLQGFVGWRGSMAKNGVRQLHLTLISTFLDLSFSESNLSWLNCW
jgi:hypothetical protein